MFDDFFKKVFGTRFKREMKRISPTVAAIHRHEERLKTLPDGELQAQTARFRAMVAERTGALAAEVVRLTKAKHDCPDAVERATLSDQLGKATTNEDRNALLREQINQQYELRKTAVERDILLQETRSPRKSPVTGVSFSVPVHATSCSFVGAPDPLSIVILPM